MPRYIQWKECPSLKYEILFLDTVCWLAFQTTVILPRATNLQLYFKGNVEHFIYSFMFPTSIDHKKRCSSGALVLRPVKRERQK